MNNEYSRRPLVRLRAWFALSQAELGRYLGLGREMVSQVERGVRPLPLPAALADAALTLAWQAGEAAPLPPPEPPDPAALHRQLREARHRAEQLAHELLIMQERSTWATRRLAALPTLTAALTAGGAAAPAWLERFASRARNELVRSGPTAQALLTARRAGLLAEATALAQTLENQQSEAKNENIFL
ncbi:hypothetical protein EJV47_05005 [Hymenobacter gummosus]|uniref:Uncharacterized protein n=1 Tax=Hymenobacter gummosus TaxID=1776032 RepID=A0A3S0H964_9BACT|nr:hypothetical protein [Hymenobacter gummosus]RTQ52375.1 hypothetical protein EJV47_05005 [Hymenobacter gummosus]